MWSVSSASLSSRLTPPPFPFGHSVDFAADLPSFQTQTLPFSAPAASIQSFSPSCSLFPNCSFRSSAASSTLGYSSRYPVFCSAQSSLLCSPSVKYFSSYCVSHFAPTNASSGRAVRCKPGPRINTWQKEKCKRSHNCKVKYQGGAVPAIEHGFKSVGGRVNGGADLQNLWGRPRGFTKLVHGWNRRYRHGRRYNTIGIQAILQWNRRPQLAGQIPRVVVITSGKGGVGKTTTTANIGLCLARLEFKVVAVDADVGLRNLDLLLGLENRVNYTAMEVLNGECRLDQALIRDKRWTNFELLCINKPRYKMPLSFGGKALTWLVDALKKRPEGSPDFILIDCPAGIDAGFITAITPANEAVLVTTPDITSLRDADRVTGLLECDGIKDIKMIVNRVRSDMIKGEDMMSVLDVQEMLGLPLLGVIPEDAEVIRSTNRGYPLVLNKPPTLAGLALEQAAWRLVEQDSMKAVLIEETPTKKGFLPFMG